MVPSAVAKFRVWRDRAVESGHFDVSAAQNERRLLRQPRTLEIHARAFVAFRIDLVPEVSVYGHAGRANNMVEWKPQEAFNVESARGPRK